MLLEKTIPRRGNISRQETIPYHNVPDLVRVMICSNKELLLTCYPVPCIKLFINLPAQRFFFIGTSSLRNTDRKNKENIWKDRKWYKSYLSARQRVGSTLVPTPMRPPGTANIRSFCSANSDTDNRRGGHFHLPIQELLSRNIRN
jgi:hypothetical protein